MARIVALTRRDTFNHTVLSSVIFQPYKQQWSRQAEREQEKAGDKGRFSDGDFFLLHRPGLKGSCRLDCVPRVGESIAGLTQ